MASASKVFLLVLLLIPALFAQDALQGQYRLSDSLYKNEKYFDAITELKRLLFFDNEQRYAYDASVLIAQCYRQGGKYTDAIEWFTKAEMNALNKEDIPYVQLEKIKIHILRRNTMQALKEVDQLFQSAGDTSNANYWKGWGYIFNDEWDKGAEYFSRSSNGNELKLISEQTSSKLYNKTTAKIMSYIIPGAGQIYTGHYFKGLLSLGWNILWGYTAINAFNADRIFDGVAVTSLLWLRFYNGNITNAEKFATEENRKISDTALDYLRNNYKGDKP